MDANTEKEIQARVEFKLNELLTAVGNTAAAEWHKAFHRNSQKHLHYHEALKTLKELMLKEINMPVPYDQMAEEKRREKRDKAVRAIVGRLLSRGDRDYHHKTKTVIAAVEQAME